MWKYFAAACAVYVFLQGFALGGFAYRQVAGTTADDTPVEDHIATYVAAHNKRRGEYIGGAIFEGASQRDKMMILDFTVPNVPSRFDEQAASENLRMQMKGKFCRDTYRSVMRDGVVFLYRYLDKSGSVLVDARVDAAFCGFA